MKILLLDIETAPNTVHVWGLFKQNVGINQILDSGYVMCWSAKWYGEEEVFFDSVYHNHPSEMLKGIHDLMDEADAIVHYNGSKFDIPTLNKEFLLYGFLPPSPSKQIDLLKTTRNKFRFPSNKLDYIAQQLGLGKKTQHSGHDLWIQCMANNTEAWKVMEEYNKNDVLLLERVYNKLKPWIKGHINVGLHQNESEVCPTCGGTHFQRRGVATTLSAKYQRYQCGDCGTWFRSVQNEGPKPAKRFASLS